MNPDSDQRPPCSLEPTDFRGRRDTPGRGRQTENRWVRDIRANTHRLCERRSLDAIQERIRNLRS